MRTTASLFTPVLLAFGMASCNDEGERSYVQYYHPKPSVIFAGNSKVGSLRNPAHGAPGHRCDIAVGDPLPISPSLPANNAAFSPFSNTTSNLPRQSLPSTTPGNAINAQAGMNPPHGKPGHRCDIAVGAPLSSAPGNANTNYQEVNLSTGKLNPAHGQPGHRCDIAVGVPLNSPPGKLSTSNNTTSAIPLPTVVNSKLNPAHGQPGHRCDIAVGAPLNSSAGKSTTTAKPDPLLSNVQAAADSLAIWNALPTDSTGAKLNPAHGQPGHDCSIAVGKPLRQ
jgi:hypothetical protein